MSFKDLLNAKLPSKKDDYFTEDTENGSSSFTLESLFTEGCGENTEITKDDVEKYGDVPDDDVKPLSAEDDQAVDETIKRIATPIIIGDTLDDDEVAVFKESVDSDIAMGEDYFTERTIVRLDKFARRKQLKKVAVFALAKQHKDILYKKLCTLWKMERNIEAKLFKKYGTQAESKSKKYAGYAAKSKSSTVKKAAKRLAA